MDDEVMARAVDELLVTMAEYLRDHAALAAEDAEDEVALLLRTLAERLEFAR